MRKEICSRKTDGQKISSAFPNLSGDQDFWEFQFNTFKEPQVGRSWAKKPYYLQISKELSHKKEVHFLSTESAGPEQMG